MAKKTQSFSDPSGLKTIKLRALASELSENGEPAFKKKYPGPFLLVVYTPSTNPGLSEHTVWTRLGGSATNRPDAITKAIPLLETAVAETARPDFKKALDYVYQNMTHLL